MCLPLLTVAVSRRDFGRPVCLLPRPPRPRSASLTPIALLCFAFVFRVPCPVSRAQATRLCGYGGGRSSLRRVLQPSRDGGSHPENARKVLRGAASTGGGVR